MHKKFEIYQKKIKGGCQSWRKVVTHNSKSDLPLFFTFEKKERTFYGSSHIVFNQFIKPRSEKSLLRLEKSHYPSSKYIKVGLVLQNWVGVMAHYSQVFGKFFLVSFIMFGSSDYAFCLLFPNTYILNTYYTSKFFFEEIHQSIYFCNMWRRFC